MPTLSGTIASIGYAAGPLFRLDTSTAAYQPSGNPGVERDRLHSAVEMAGASIAALMQTTSGDSAAILEFQIAMLEDEALSAPAYAAIAQGWPANAAWSQALAAEIVGYEAAEDAYFRARSIDLGDIRDRVLRALSGAADAAPPPGAVLFGSELTPTQFLSVDWGQGGGIIVSRGSPSSHVAILARGRGVPMLVGVNVLDGANDDPVLLDAEHGRIVVLPDPEARREFLKASTAHLQLLRLAHTQLDGPATTSDGQRIELLVNIGEPSDIDMLDVAHCDGVGLMRTEFLFGRGLADEETQYAAYRKVLGWAAGKPVTIRTLDAGGDKPVPGLTPEETNPFLGLRGIRLSLTRPDVFRVQIRALLRAAPHGSLHVMFPMVSLAAEYRAAVALCKDVADELRVAGVPHAMPPLGIMVEVPVAAIAPDAFVDAAFFSIGSNDLIQYVMAAGRDNADVASLNRVTHPAILSLIAGVARFGTENGIPVSLCGDAGGDPAAIPALLRAGLRALSVTPGQLPLAKAAISRSAAADVADAQA